MKSRTRQLFVILLALVIALQIAPIAIAAPGDAPSLTITAAAEVVTVDPGDEFVIDITIDMLPEAAAGPIGWSDVGFRVYYDSAMVTVVPVSPPRPFIAEIQPIGDINAQYGAISALNHPESNRINILLSTHMVEPAFDKAVVRVRFAVLDTAPDGPIDFTWSIIGAAGHAGEGDLPDDMYFVPVNPATDFVRVWVGDVPPGGGGAQPAQRTVTFDANSGTLAANGESRTVNSGQSLGGGMPGAPTRAGYVFNGWNTAADGSGEVFTAATAVRADITVFAQWNAPGAGGGGGQYQPGPGERFHEAFMRGYPDGTFRPTGSVTRAEVTAILVRTMIESYSPDAPIPSIPNVMTDVATGAWYYRYIAWAYAHGLVSGYADGTFRPNNPITREEFAAMLARTGTVLTAGDIPFGDADSVSSWALDYVYTVLRSFWMQGDNLGNFNPRSNLLRSEAAATVARMLGRGDTTAESIAGVLNSIRIFQDAANVGHWFYFYIIEATNSHWFTMEDGLEIWTRVVP